MRTSPLARRLVACLAWLLLAPGGAAAAPVAAVLVAPSGEISGSTIVFTWNAVVDATWYQLWIGTSQGATVQQWYTADQAHCPSGGACSAMLTLGLSGGEYNWYIQTWNPTGAGAWSAASSVTFRDSSPSWTRRLAGPSRYGLVFDNLAVLDKETGLVWQREPSTATFSFSSASYLGCTRLTVGGRMGWRLPSASELLSVLDPFTDFGLVPGHPFALGAPPIFWTATDYDAARAVVITTTQLSGLNIATKETVSHRVWCVRGPGSDRMDR